MELELRDSETLGSNELHGIRCIPEQVGQHLALGTREIAQHEIGCGLSTWRAADTDAHAGEVAGADARDDVADAVVPSVPTAELEPPGVEGDVEFIVQHDDLPSIYRDMYAYGQEGQHHVAYLVHDFEAEYQRLIAMGFEPACRLYADGVDAAYFDTRSVTGGFTEIHGDPPHILGSFATWRRAHELYRPGVDPVKTIRAPRAPRPTPATSDPGGS